MVYVIASITVKEKKLADLLAIYEDFVPQVHTEPGCLLYQPTVDLDIGVSTQKKDASVVTVIEHWKDAEAFKGHLVEPHSAAFREKIKGIVENVSIKVLSNAEA